MTKRAKQNNPHPISNEVCWLHARHAKEHIHRRL